MKFCTEIPEINVSAVREGAFWRFTVADNGIGIEPKNFANIFVIFRRLHTRAEFAGTGIGLAIVTEIIERHGGKVGVDSTPGQGTSFWFTLQAVDQVQP